MTQAEVVQAALREAIPGVEWETARYVGASHFYTEHEGTKIQVALVDSSPVLLVTIHYPELHLTDPNSLPRLREILQREIRP